jgi:hypothetical protein
VRGETRCAFALKSELKRWHKFRECATMKGNKFVTRMRAQKANIRSWFLISQQWLWRFKVRKDIYATCLNKDSTLVVYNFITELPTETVAAFHCRVNRAEAFDLSLVSFPLYGYCLRKIKSVCWGEVHDTQVGKWVVSSAALGLIPACHSCQTLEGFLNFCSSCYLFSNGYDNAHY